MSCGDSKPPEKTMTDIANYCIHTIVLQLEKTLLNWPCVHENLMFNFVSRAGRAGGLQKHSFFYYQLSRDSCRLMRKCREFRLICIHRPNFRLFWFSREMIGTRKCPFCSSSCPFPFVSFFLFLLRFFPLLLVASWCGFVSRLLPSIDLFRLLWRLIFEFLISSFPQVGESAKSARLKKKLCTKGYAPGTHITKSGNVFNST